MSTNTGTGNNTPASAPPLKPRILLVEDNEMNRDMLSRRLQRSGYEVIPASDGQQAVEMTFEQKPDLILMDLSLPVMDGWEATKKIKENEATQHIPLIVLTAHALKADREDAFSIGCDDFDIKPVDFKRLSEKIGALLAANRAGSGPT